MINRILYIGVCLSIIAVIGTSLIISREKGRYVQTSIVTFPSDAGVNLNGLKVKNKTTLYVKSGRYVVEVFRDGFKPKTIILDTADGDIPTPVNLVANSKTGTDWVSSHHSEYVNFEQVASDAASQRGDRLRSEHPVLSKLPYSTYLFSIGYRVNNLKSDNHIEITVDAPEVYVQNAIAQIRVWGYNPADYDITFTNTRNVFDE